MILASNVQELLKYNAASKYVIELGNMEIQCIVAPIYGQNAETSSMWNSLTIHKEWEFISPEHRNAFSELLPLLKYTKRQGNFIVSNTKTGNMDDEDLEQVVQFIRKLKTMYPATSTTGLPAQLDQHNPLFPCNMLYNFKLIYRKLGEDEMFTRVVALPSTLCDTEIHQLSEEWVSINKAKRTKMLTALMSVHAQNYDYTRLVSSGINKSKLIAKYPGDKHATKLRERELGY
jgi:predicted CopG family antitoxin